jgi:hypothetical protein
MMNKRKEKKKKTTPQRPSRLTLTPKLAKSQLKSFARKDVLPPHIYRNQNGQSRPAMLQGFGSGCRIQSRRPIENKKKIMWMPHQERPVCPTV